MAVIVVEPETGPDWTRRAPEWRYLKALAFLMEDLLGSSQTDKFGDPTFRFPHIFRRVETLHVLSGNGERRSLSLDLDTGYLGRLRERCDQGRYSIKVPKNRWPMVRRFDDLIPIPFAVFHKGILHDFSAHDELDRPLGLVGKSLSLLAGLAWCVNAIPDKEISRLGDDRVWQLVLNHVWEIIQYIPRRREDEKMEGPWGAPDWWFPREDMPDRDRVFVELLRLTGLDGGQPTLFQQRLRLLSVNYFPLLLVPGEVSSQPHQILKLAWTHGRPAEEWLRHHRIGEALEEAADEARSPAGEARKSADEKSAGKASSPTSRRFRRLASPAGFLGSTVNRFIRGSVLPHGPYPYDLGLFGDLEGHCEHLNIEMPSGVEVVGGCFLPDRNWVGVSRAERRAKVPPTDQVYRDAWARQPVGLERHTIEKHTSVKMTRHSISLRRHKGLPGGVVKIRASIAPSLDGVFLPASISLGILILLMVLVLVYYAMRDVEIPRSGSGGDALNVLQYLPLITTLVAGAGSFLVSREDQPLRMRMLRRVLVRVYTALLIGASMLIVYYFMFATQLVTCYQLAEGQGVAWWVWQFILPSRPAWHDGNAVAGWVLHLGLNLSVLWALYAMYFLVHSRIILAIARIRLDDIIGHTSVLHVAATEKPDVYSADRLGVVGRPGAAFPRDAISVSYTDNEDKEHAVSVSYTDGEGKKRVVSQAIVQSDGSFQFPIPPGMPSGLITVTQKESSGTMVATTTVFLDMRRCGARGLARAPGAVGRRPNGCAAGARRLIAKVREACR